MHKIRRRVWGSLAGLSLAAAATVAAAGPAAAAPTGCGPGWAGVGNTYATAYCSGGTGYFRVWVQCQSTVWPYGWVLNQSGWTRPGNTAWAFCQIGGSLVRWGIDRTG